MERLILDLPSPLGQGVAASSTASDTDCCMHQTRYDTSSAIVKVIRCVYIVVVYFCTYRK